MHSESRPGESRLRSDSFCFASRLAAWRAINDGPSIISSMRSLCRVIAPSGNMISGRRRSTRMSIAVSIAWRSLPSRKTLKAPIRRIMNVWNRLCLNKCQLAIANRWQSASIPRMPSTNGSDMRQWLGASMMLCFAAQRGPESFHVPAFDRVNAIRLAQIAAQIRAKQDRPPLRINRRHELIGFVDDDFLHSDPRTCPRKLSQSAQPEDAAIAYPTRTVSAQGKRSRSSRMSIVFYEHGAGWFVIVVIVACQLTVGFW